jgi:hypothetical protein
MGIVAQASGREGALKLGMMEMAMVSVPWAVYFSSLS